MNRPIKFRAWDTKNARMLYDLGLYREGWSASLELCAVQDAWNKNGERLIWEQFTGLLDKNGKEIYEGDIVTCEGGYDYPEGQVAECENPRIVRWNPAMLQFVAACDDCRDEIPLHEYDLNKIISNIHENPELLP